MTVVRHPTSGFLDDVAATKRVFDQQDGPVILVGNSHGGTVITVAGADPKVRALVYVAARQPYAGETTIRLATSMPEAVPGSDLKPAKDGFIFGNPTNSGPTSRRICQTQAQFMTNSQVPVVAAASDAPVTVAAWRDQTELRDRRHSRWRAQSHACALDVQALRAKDDRDQGQPLVHILTPTWSPASSKERSAHRALSGPAGSPSPGKAAVMSPPSWSQRAGRCC